MLCAPRCLIVSCMERASKNIISKNKKVALFVLCKEMLKKKEFNLKVAIVLCCVAVDIYAR